MNFKIPLYSGILLKRYKRFFADVKFNNEIIICHCPNPGSMKGLLNVGNKVYFSKSDNPKRKLKFTLEMIEIDGDLVGINTLRTNSIAKDLLLSKKFLLNYGYDEISSEIKVNNKTRLDFALIKSGKIIGYVEVKNVTLVRNLDDKENRLAEFPDSITSRGDKHLKELINLSKKGFLCIMLYIIQRSDCKNFAIAKDIDINYAESFKKATNLNLEILAYGCKLSKKSIVINNKMNIKEL